MARAFILTSLLLLVAPIARNPGVKPAWKESGYIGSCAARGCLGRRSLCQVYSFPSPEGGRNTFYCYLNE